MVKYKCLTKKACTYYVDHSCPCYKCYICDWAKTHIVCTKTGFHFIATVHRQTQYLSIPSVSNVKINVDWSAFSELFYQPQLEQWHSAACQLFVVVKTYTRLLPLLLWPTIAALNHCVGTMTSLVVSSPAPHPTNPFCKPYKSHGKNTMEFIYM